MKFIRSLSPFRCATNSLSGHYAHSHQPKGSKFTVSGCFDDISVVSSKSLGGFTLFHVHWIYFGMQICDRPITCPSDTFQLAHGQYIEYFSQFRFRIHYTSKTSSRSPVLSTAFHSFLNLHVKRTLTFPFMHILACPRSQR